MLPGELRDALSEQAHRRGISIGALVRKALARELARDGAAQDAFLNDTRVARGGTPRHVADRHDDYLYGEKR